MNVLNYFLEISKIPRASGNMKDISMYLEKFGRTRNLWTERDIYDNVIIKKPASGNCESGNPVILQAHMDIVAEKTKDSKHNFDTSPIEVIEEDGYLRAKDTTLGADDGIGVAYILAVLDSGINSEEISHPDIIAVFTTNEETGMDGARGIDKSIIKAERMINIDQEQEKVVLTGSAGGKTLICTIPVKYYMVNGLLMSITIDGLKGGHSGDEIDKGRGNSNILMGRLVKKISETINPRIVAIHGGNKDNAIPRETTLDIVVNAGTEMLNVNHIVRDYKRMFAKELGMSDKNVDIKISIGDNGNYKVIFPEDIYKVVNFLYTVPNGVLELSAAIPGMVDTSCNVGVLYSDEVSVCADVSVRSMYESRKNNLAEKIDIIVKTNDGFAHVKSEYPEWEYTKDSELQQLFTSVYRDLYSDEIKCSAIHAGLECGYFNKLSENMDIVSIGPDIEGIHTTEERLNIESAIRTYDWLVAVLSKL